MKLKFSYYSLTSFLLILGLLCFLIAVLSHQFGQENVESRVDKAQTILQQLDKQLQRDIQELYGIGSEEQIHEFFLESERVKNGFSYYVLTNRKLQHWSANEPVLDERLAASLVKDGKLTLPNGEFLFRTVGSDEKKVLGLLLLKHSYAYENRYLQNEFNPVLQLSPWVVSSPDGKMVLTDPEQEVLFHLTESAPEYAKASGFSSAFYMLGFILLLFSFLAGMRSRVISNPVQVGFFAGLVILFRVAMIYFRFPSELYGSDLFSPHNYASSFFFHSLGDLLLNSLLIACFAVLFFIHQTSGKKQMKNWFLLQFFSLIFLIVFAYLVHTLLTGLVMNSRISFDLSRFSSLGMYTVLAFACMALLLMSLILFISGMVFKKNRIRFGSGWTIVMVTITSLYTAVVINIQNQKKESESRKLFAQKVESRRDHIAEYLFSDIQNKISTDTLLQFMMQDEGAEMEDFNRHISGNYFLGYLAKFDLDVYAFNESGKSLYAQGYTDSLGYFTGLAEREGKSTFSDKLFYLKDESGRLSYMAILPVDFQASNQMYHLVLIMTARFFQSDQGFPELFLGGMSEESSEPVAYSVASYVKGELVYEYGDYAYSFSSEELEQASGGEEFVTLNDHRHLLYYPNDQSLIVVSKPEKGKLELLTLFSWIFAFFGIFFAIMYFVFRLLTGMQWKPLNLTQRIQTSVILLVLSSFVLIGTGTLLYIIGKYKSDQKRSISAQVNGLWFLLNNSMDLQNPLSSIPLELKRNNLNELVRDLNLDFNLYDEQGFLYYSSQPKIYEQKIISNRMNPEALHEIRRKGKTQSILPENAGKLSYIAAYSPFTDRSGKLTGILNLPYFEKQNELNREISGFFSALINIYVLLFVLAVLLTLFISSRITKPLLLIQEKLSRVRLGISNEPINYNRQDEIGQLVEEYNRMLEELSSSAEKLAQSERESAWREMAKQVAHEIKNPLTPMKLSVQHLQRAWKESHDNKEDLLNKTAETIIRQIDTLSNIATEFSNFAKMPDPKIQRIEITSVLESAVALFRETPDVEIKFQSTHNNMYMKSDPDQLLRAFSNLLKNAIQSIPEDRKGLITVEIQRSPDDSCTIRITDNGVGISENQKDKIFNPNFTTKSSGMGLGLSLVKNIVQFSGGKVWFTEGYAGGTSFFVWLPLSD